MKYLYAFLAIFAGLSIIYDTICTFFLRVPYGDLPKWTLASVCLSVAICIIVWTIRWTIWNKEPWE